VPEPERITIAQVAKRAGVSTAAAGRVLGEYGYASEDIRTRVREAADALGYSPNMLAKGLVTGKTKTIGVVAADIDSPFYARVLRGIGDIARPHGFGVILTNSDENLEREQEAVQLLLEKRVDGLIIAPCDTQESPHLKKAVASGCPVVQIDRIARNLPADSVTVDNRTAAREAVAYLIDQGHERIGIVAELEQAHHTTLEAFLEGSLASPPPTDSLYPSWQRLLGYLEAHRDAGIPVDDKLVRRAGSYSASAAAAEGRQLLQMGMPPTAVFAADGTMSTGLMTAIAEAGARVPDDVSVLCFDELDWMEFLQPGLTSVAQPVHRIGTMAAELILSRINGDTSVFRHHVLSAALNKRNSVARR
jgi:LacI family transcriptional regulator